ncbi:hypothetical protein [uncultured Desulfovibrio sp.]|uniref:hypothetical protein n=1 Tax=uncultured Desulfovibrio sp. TaxID=167968 RepID=UPI002630E3E1|nr:hypothetical protein [uncultured Desulfovibrio sp.]
MQCAFSHKRKNLLSKKRGGNHAPFHKFVVELLQSVCRPQQLQRHVCVPSGLQNASGYIVSEIEQTPAISQVQADFMTYTHNSAKGRAEWSSLDLKDMSLEQLNVQMESITEQISSLREELALLHGLGETASEAEKEAGSELKQQIKNLQNDLEKTLKQMRKVSQVSG